MMASIQGYGVYIPKYRIKAEEIARIWGEDPDRIKKGLGILQKSVPDVDEDTASMAVMAARRALRSANINGERIGALFVGSESHPYAVKPTATIVAEAIGATPSVFGADMEFACKAATTGLISILGMVDSGIVEHGMAIGSDSAQGRPGDALEYSAGAGAVALITGKNGFADVEGVYSYMTDTPDFWRNEGERYPRHGGRFTGEPAYFRHVMSAAKGLMEKLGLSKDDIDRIVFHQPNAKFPIYAAKKLGFDLKKLEPHLAVRHIGNTYSASSLMGLSLAFDHASEGERILLVSFGSGAGSDAFSFVINDRIDEVRSRTITFEEAAANPVYVDYGVYAKMKGILC